MAVEAEQGTPPKVAPWNDPRYRGWFFQVVTAVALVWFVWYIAGNTIANLEKQNIATGFGFLSTTAGFGVNQTLIDYAETSTYGQAFLVGLLNTLLVAVIGIVLASPGSRPSTSRCCATFRCSCRSSSGISAC
jgi:general L-amino acid transport system permease protein